MKKGIVNYVQPYEGEATFSWLQHMAVINAYRSRFEMMADAKGIPAAMEKIRGRYDAFDRLDLLFNDNGQEQNALLSIFLRTSTYPGLFPVLSPWEQFNLFSKTYNPIEDNSIVMPCDDAIPVPRVCPECRKEAIAKGIPLIYLRIHQMPGVHVCPIHHCALLEYDGELGDEFGENAKFKPCSITDGDDGYAAFAKEILEASLNTDATVLRDMIRSSAINTSSISNSPLWDAKLSLFYNKLLSDQFINCGVRHCEDWLKILYLAYGNVQAIVAQLPGSRQDLFTSLIHKKNYSLSSNYYEPAMLLQDDLADKQFLASAPSIRIGWESPARMAAWTSDDRFRHIVSVMSDGRYVPVTSFNGMQKKVILKQEDSKENITVTAGDFLHYQDHCTSIKKAHQRDEQFKAAGLDNRYVIMQHSDKKTPMVLRCKRCGRIFTVKSFFQFKKYPLCPGCDGNQQLKIQAAFDTKVKQLTGNDYSRVSEYISEMVPLEMKHNRCGNVFRVTPERFLHGHRCPYCDDPCATGPAALADYVRIKSRGEYVIVGARSSVYIIQSTVDGTMHNMARAYIIQELDRPTPSPVLPLSFDTSKPEAQQTHTSNPDMVACLSKKEGEDNA